jgi:UDP-glucose 4-epimerase
LSSTRETILVTGGAGFIGSHTCVVLAEAGYQPVILDNLGNSREDTVARVSELVGRRIELVRGDTRDAALLDRVFREHKIASVMHFADLKAVGQSIEQPLTYYDNNIGGAIQLFAAMRRAEVRRLIFSSSATVYGAAERLPIAEDAPRSASNPYGRTKLMVEDILADLHRAEPGWAIACLRYFNPAGAHPSGLIGEDPKGVPDNLVPFIAQVAAGRRGELSVWGSDYPTPDGTGVRDFVHVMDLAEGHLAAMKYLADHPGLISVNLGSGKGHSVLEMLAAFGKASGRPIPYRLGARRPGDVASSWTDPRLARELLGWQARRGIDEMCADAWRWMQHAGNDK